MDTYVLHKSDINIYIIGDLWKLHAFLFFWKTKSNGIILVKWKKSWENNFTIKSKVLIWICFSKPMTKCFNLSAIHISFHHFKGRFTYSFFPFWWLIWTYTVDRRTLAVETIAQKSLTNPFHLFSGVLKGNIDTVVELAENSSISNSSPRHW